MDMLFAHWFQCNSDANSGWDAKWLPHLQFFDKETHLYEAFGFVDLSSIVHSVHLIPMFSFGTTEQLLGPSFIQKP